MAGGQQIPDFSSPNPAAIRLAQQELNQLLQKKLPGQPPTVVERAAQDFIGHLRDTSPIIAETYAAGRMSEDDLSSRLDVFIGDHPEYTGLSIQVSRADPRQSVSDLLKSAPDLARTDPERMALADRFIEHLGNLSGTARTDLISGRLSRDELQSRVGVFVADLRAEASRVSADPAVAAAVPIVDAYVRANFGSASDRINSICLRGFAEEGTNRREFVVFKMRPNLLRIHIVGGGLVVGVMGYDGTTAWVQSPGRPPVPAAKPQADTLSRTSGFDDPLVGYRERGAIVRIQERPANGPILLHVSETDGTEIIAAIDPSTYNQLSLRIRHTGGHWIETHFEDYRRIGAVNIPFVQKEFEDGVLRSTTRYTDATLDPGLVDRFFAHPATLAFDYMDFMGGLSVMDAREKKAAAAGSQIKISQ
jgi:hypothetical protein